MSTATLQIDLPVRTLSLVGALEPERMLRGVDVATAQTASDIQEKRALDAELQEGAGNA